MTSEIRLTIRMAAAGVHGQPGRDLAAHIRNLEKQVLALERQKASLLKQMEMCGL